MIRALVFDCFGVFYPDPVFAYMNDPQTPFEKVEALHTLDEQAARGRITKEEFINKAATLLNRPNQEIDQQFFQRHDNNKELIEFVKNTRSKYKTALLSNIGGDMMNGFFTEEEYKKLFDLVVLTGNEKFAKPDKEIFALVCERLNVAPQEVVMIDDVSKNCEAAKNIEMQAICYKNFPQFQKELNIFLK